MLKRIARLVRRELQGESPVGKSRICRFEKMEPRRLLAADVQLGAVYFEEATGDDSQPDILEVSFEGGVEGTELTQIVIDTDKLGNDQLDSGDVIFDTADGGLGVFDSVGLSVVSHDGFEITGVSVVDGGTKIVIDLSGFDAGEKLVFSVDADEVTFANAATGEMDITSVVEGGEFQRSRITGTFVVPNFETLELTATFWDAYDKNFQKSAEEAGTTLDLHPDRYSTTNDLSDRTAGAVAHAPQIPIPASISGYVYYDKNDDGIRDPGEEGIAGVTVQVVAIKTADGSTGTFTAVTDKNGYWEVDGLVAGEYKVTEVVQPDGYFDGKDTPGTIDGVTVGSAVTPDADMLVDVTLAGGDNGIEYNFGEIKPASISGRVIADYDGDCEFTPGDKPLEGVQVDLLDANGKLVATTKTDADGYYEFTGLRPGQYTVFEHQPQAYLDGDDHVGSEGGKWDGVDTLSAINLGPGVKAVNYNFCEIPPASISGRVIADNDGDCEFTPGDKPLEGVRVDLLDADGKLVATTKTDADGYYEFANLAPGQYTVYEHQPQGYLDGDDHVGSEGGKWDGVDTLSDINLGAGVDAVHYDFCEVPPVSISGYVYYDKDNDGVFDPDETGIGGVTIKLLDANGNPLGITAVTSSDPDNLGYYEFTGLLPGTYGVMEIHPDGWIDGLDTPGNAGGLAQNPGDMIRGAVLQVGLNGEQYNFGELLPGSISGRVIADTNNNCVLDEGEDALEGVVVELLDADGKVITTTTTDEGGYYQFDNLVPGVYQVREQQPDGYFQGDEMVGTGTGVILAQDYIGAVEIGSDVHLVDYNFCEIPPGEISGYVFQDGDTLVTTDGQPPDNLYEVRDGQRTPDDTALAGVTLELRDGVTGEPIDASVALPGYYSSGPIRVVTDANGYYEFLGLPPGNYAVYQVQPTGYIDSLDTPGSLGGLAINATNPVSPLIVSQLLVDPANDAIIRIQLGAGQDSVENNFSEVKVTTTPFWLPPPEPLPPVTPFVEPPYIAQVQPLRPLQPVLMAPPPEMPEGAGVPGYTWHLSVIDAGHPREEGADEAVVSLTGTRFDFVNWQGDSLEGSEWMLKRDGENDQDVHERLRLVFGSPEAIPVTGDFNGDGVYEVGVFIDGEWFIDVNGNGQWDEGDLWAKLGARDDQPVTGDWNGDGKTDIGIFGPVWPGDPRAIKHEPGLPDPYNQRFGKAKNVPPTVAEATLGKRTLKLTAHGPVRTHLIDHVFHYGTAGDRAIAGDWNGDGIHTIGVFRGGQWNLDSNGDGRFTEKDLAFSFGQQGDLPVVGDWSGNGVDQIGVYRAGTWILDTNNNRQIDAQDKVFEMGQDAALPVVGDWNADGVDDPGLYRAGVL